MAKRKSAKGRKSAGRRNLPGRKGYKPSSKQKAAYYKLVKRGYDRTKKALENAGVI